MHFKRQNLVILAHTCNLSNWETEPGRTLPCCPMEESHLQYTLRVNSEHAAEVCFMRHYCFGVPLTGIQIK
ncbi:hypothetical protein LEMLEM_LOCUS12157 [Lemmus lemmus]